MSSTYSYTVSPASLHGHQDDRDPEPHYTDISYTQHNHPAALDSQQLLSPHSSHVRSNSASPSNNSHTPAESTSTLSVLPSDFSSDFGDPFFGVNFNDPDGGTPSFLDEQSFLTDISSTWPTQNISDPFNGQSDTPSPREPTPIESNTSAPQLTPDTNAESWSGANSPAPAAPPMASPRVTVSVWDKDGEHPVHTLERSFAHGSESSQNLRMGNEDTLSTKTVHGSLPSVSRDTYGGWIPDSATGQRGLAPERRSSGETLSVNQLASTRKTDEKNQEVASWVAETVDRAGNNAAVSISESHVANQTTFEDDNIPTDEIPLGHTTVNRYVPDQVYYNTDFQDNRSGEQPGDGFRPTDFELLPTRNWANAPMIHSISQIDSMRNQPESSQAAIQKFERMCQDNASVVSHAATWGTRRRSMPSIYDTEGVISGSFFKKLSLKDARRPSILKKIPSLVRRPSHNQILKRKGSNGDDTPSEESNSSNRRESRDSLAPPPRSPSWGMRQKQIPSLNTAIVSMTTGAASIATSHARSGSISATSLVSPKSPFGLAPVKNHLRRPRSKTEIPKAGLSHPNIVGMLKKAGGPPVAQLAKSQVLLDIDDDDDDDDEVDDLDMKVESSKADEIVPTLDGFQQHVLGLNPNLANTNQYLVERIGHQMVIRFKNLQNQKIKHLKAAHSGHCTSGAFCVENGGVAVPLDPRGDTRGVDPLSSRPASPDGDQTPLEGGINVETFPLGIPMPPTTVLPAEFECQICFTSRKFIKPSDWTKHVHEDVQPFTCTWDRCRDPKMFKRKADWVRHENEGHRHLEWWTCDVEDCKHTCYRRDNFLQHLVREHKFTEPKVKTKAAIKKAGGTDPTWQKVERCHVETSARPQDEPCRFCNKTFPTWKKLTVHLAKHMEHISLPVLRLVSAKDLSEDTIISPVQEPPPRNFGSLPTPVKTEAPTFNTSRPHAFSNPMDYSPHGAFGFQPVEHNQVPHFYNQHQPSSHFDTMSQNPSGGLMMPQVTTGFPSQQYHQPMPVSAAQSYGNGFIPMQNHLEPFPAFNNPLGLQDTSGSQMSYDNLNAPAMPNADHYSSHGSASPYSHSPHQGNNGFYNQ